ncbi:MAG: NAD(P)-dependent oxidoreductase [Burkholderiaceae bacterium]|nr:NAD(P)-dependent oxidoreductase [Burkholderiaceae bacterium]
MRIFITGASGQIGTNLALRCLKEGHQVFGVDRRPNSWTTAFDVIPFDLAHAQPASALDEAVRRHGRPDVVVHLAAHAKVHLLTREPHLALENITMVQQALEYCRRHRLPIVFASSREVYGSARRPLTHEDHAGLNDVASPYAASKMAGEALVRSYGACYGLPWLIFRLSNVYGRYDNDLARMERVIPLFTRQLQQGQPLTIYGADKVLDFTYVDDCVDGLLRGIQHLLAGTVACEVFNLARGEGHSLVTMAQWLAEALGCTAQLNIEPSQTGEVSHYVADISRARERLGFAPATGLREGLGKALAWAEARP